MVPCLRPSSVVAADTADAPPSRTPWSLASRAIALLAAVPEPTPSRASTAKPLPRLVWWASVGAGGGRSRCGLSDGDSASWPSEPEDTALLTLSPRSFTRRRSTTSAAMATAGAAAGAAVGAAAAAAAGTGGTGAVTGAAAPRWTGGTGGAIDEGAVDGSGTAPDCGSRLPVGVSCLAMLASRLTPQCWGVEWLRR